jgi:CRISPR-associated protein Cmr4
MQSRLMMIFTRSPLHCGTGHARGAVDLPIAREGVCGLPMIPASGIKGALRNASLDARLSSKKVSDLFGPSVREVSESPRAGELSFGDAALVALPVSSLSGVFAYVTSPHALGQLMQDVQSIGGHTPDLPAPAGKALVTSTSALTQTLANGATRAFLSEYSFDAQTSPLVDQWARCLGEWLSLDPYTTSSLQERLCVVNNDSFRDLVARGVETHVRVSLDRDTRTAANGALWTEENLPKSSLLYSMCHATPNQRGRSARDAYSDLAQTLKGEVQVGGNATIGRGRCHMNLVEVPRG